MTEILESKLAALIIANKELAIQNQEMAQKVAEHVTANKELAIQNQDMARQAADLVTANKELAIQNHVMTLQATELAMANKELAVQAEQKALRAAELVIANKELAIQAEQKTRRAAELVLANAELAIQAEQKELRAAELLIEKSRAEAANIAKSSFLANMSHEIRTPMNGIVGMANILRREGVTPKQADHLEKIDIAAQHLLVIINNILDISKIEAGKFVLEEIPLTVSNLLTNVGAILAERLKAKNILNRPGFRGGRLI